MSTLYLNHAGTSWPKPPPVQQAVRDALELDPTRWPDRFRQDHATVARFFGLASPERLLPTPGGTSALATAIADLPLGPGDRVLTSRFEHHALHRNLLQLQAKGVQLDYVEPAADAPVDLEALRALLEGGNVRLVAMTSASNVTGDLLPIERVTQMAHEYDAWMLVDASQTAGWIDLDLTRAGADIVALAGHKGLQAPWGIGYLYLAEQLAMQTPAAVCEVGARAAACSQPGYCDVGSVDRLALAGAAAAVEWLEREEQRDRLQRARQNAQLLSEAFDSLPRFRRVGLQSSDHRLPTVAFVREDQTPAETGRRLADQHVVASAGLQCAPLAHQTLGTAPDGVVRISFGPDSAPDTVDEILKRLEA